MLKASIRINLEGAEFFDPVTGKHAPHAEVARILRQLVTALDEGDAPYALKDINGKEVCTFDLDVLDEDDA